MGDSGDFEWVGSVPCKSNLGQGVQTSSLQNRCKHRGHELPLYYRWLGEHWKGSFLDNIILYISQSSTHDAAAQCHILYTRKGNMSC